MKIGQFEPKTSSTTPAAVDRRTSASSAETAGVEPSAKVQLSSASAVAPSGEDSSFDAAKVERIAAAIRDGSYRIDAGAIADKLIANAQELISRGTGR